MSTIHNRWRNLWSCVELQSHTGWSFSAFRLNFQQFLLPAFGRCSISEMRESSQMNFWPKTQNHIFYTTLRMNRTQPHTMGFCTLRHPIHVLEQRQSATNALCQSVTFATLCGRNEHKRTKRKLDWDLRTTRPYRLSGDKVKCMELWGGRSSANMPGILVVDLVALEIKHIDDSGGHFKR